MHTMKMKNEIDEIMQMLEVMGKTKQSEDKLQLCLSINERIDRMIADILFF